MTAPPPHLVHALVASCEDAFFALTAKGALDLEALGALSKRRQAMRAATSGDGAPAAGMSAWDAWLVGLCAAIAPIAPPRWLPMAELVDALSLEHGARGVRSFFTSKPSERDVARVRTLGSMAVRSLASVLAATGTFTPDAKLLRRALIVSLGFPPGDEHVLDQEAATDAEKLDLDSTMDAKIARAIVRGAFFAAMGDGMDPREEQAVLAIGRKCGLTSDDVNGARTDARKAIEGSKDFGQASVDAVRFVLSDDLTEAEPLAIAAARLTLPVVYRREAVTAINIKSPVAMGQKFSLDRRQRGAVLALAWVSALRADPTTTRRAQLAARHDTVAEDLGAVADGGAVRSEVERFFEGELAAAS